MEPYLFNVARRRSTSSRLCGTGRLAGKWLRGKAPERDRAGETPVRRTAGTAVLREARLISPSGRRKHAAVL